ncbi:GNAT family N-acetyltransferase [Xenorhabdus bovienii]|uniref:GNAT family N-acetyltransferase n=1 Tax=Xenorhabdus bovienii TaxID=40576 RepID=UPI0021572CAE|nr:GNAT family N-acetyltransferase [Xenorhabdus bovienii]
MSEKSNNKCVFKRVTASEWRSTIFHWANTEQWNMVESDISRFFNVDPHGFFITYRNGMPISSMSMVNYSDTYTHAGHYIVPPEFRNHVCAGKIWKSSIAYAEHRTISCDGNSHISSLYEKRGFVPHYRTFRMSGVIIQPVIQPAEALPITQANIADVIKYDAECTGVCRGRLLADWFWGEGRYGFCTRSDTGVTGIIGIRKSTDGYRLGPFHADNADVLETLFRAALAQVPAGEAVTFDAPETDNNQFIPLAKEYGLRELFYTFRMYKGNVIPKGHLEKLRAIASLELG